MSAQRASALHGGAIVRAAFVGLFAIACLAHAAAAGEIRRFAGERSFKGWELYSWADGAQWRFALLYGTNRIKFCGEVKSPKGALTLDEAAQALDGLADLEWVTWIAPGEMLAQRECPLALPPPAMIERLRQVCERRKLHCTNWIAADTRPKN